MTTQVLYHTEVENAEGIAGRVHTINSNDLNITVSSPLSSEAGTNPEQLLGAAFATCLNATLEAEEKRQGLAHRSVVRVLVDMSRDVIGFQFHVEARVYIPDVERRLAQNILDTAAQRCRVDKLLSGSKNVVVRLVDSLDES